MALRSGGCSDRRVLRRRENVEARLAFQAIVRSTMTDCAAGSPCRVPASSSRCRPVLSAALLCAVLAAAPCFADAPLSLTASDGSGLTLVGLEGRAVVSGP